VTSPQIGTLQLLPFRAVRYNTSVSDLAAVVAPPYDVIDDSEQAALEAADPHNVVRLILPRDPGIPGVDRYSSAAQTFEQWLDDDTLMRPRSTSTSNPAQELCSSAGCWGRWSCSRSTAA
jgi:uncharacterized protein (DUF1015 family)